MTTQQTSEFNFHTHFNYDIIIDNVKFTQVMTMTETVTYVTTREIGGKVVTVKTSKVHEYSTSEVKTSEVKTCEVRAGKTYEDALMFNEYSTSAVREGKTYKEALMFNVWHEEADDVCEYCNNLL